MNDGDPVASLGWDLEIIGALEQEDQISEAGFQGLMDAVICYKNHPTLAEVEIDGKPLSEWYNYFDECWYGIEDQEEFNSSAQEFMRTLKEAIESGELVEPDSISSGRFADPLTDYLAVVGDSARTVVAPHDMREETGEDFAPYRQKK